MRLKRLIKRFEFMEPNRNRITLGTDVRLNPTTHKLQLKAASNDTYPITANLYAKTWIANPSSVKGWLGFECEVSNPKDNLSQEITGVNFRLSDGTDEYWWNGSAWEINTVDWNTEEEIATNIVTFSSVSKKLQVVVNLYTTDSEYTPEVSVIKVLYSSDVSHQEDYIYRTVVRQLRKQLRPISDFPITLAAPTSTIDLNVYELETPYNIVGIDSVFNHTDDSEHITDLYDSYDEGTKTITLSNSIDSGKVAWVRFIFEPEVAVTTGLEYSEIEKVPSVILNNVSLINTRGTMQEDWVVNKANNTAVKVPAPLQNDIQFTLNAITDSARDQVRLADELKSFFANNPSLTSHGLDEKFRLWLVDEYDSQGSIGQGGIHAGKLRFLLVNTLFFEREAIDMYSVKSFKVTGDMNIETN